MALALLTYSMRNHVRDLLALRADAQKKLQREWEQSVQSQHGKVFNKDDILEEELGLANADAFKTALTEAMTFGYLHEIGKPRLASRLKKRFGMALGEMDLSKDAQMPQHIGEEFQFSADMPALFKFAFDMQHGEDPRTATKHPAKVILEIVPDIDPESRRAFSKQGLTNTPIAEMDGHGRPQEKDTDRFFFDFAIPLAANDPELDVSGDDLRKSRAEVFRKMVKDGVWFFTKADALRNPKGQTVFATTYAPTRKPLVEVDLEFIKGLEIEGGLDKLFQDRGSENGDMRQALEELYHQVRSQIRTVDSDNYRSVLEGVKDRLEQQLFNGEQGEFKVYRGVLAEDGLPKGKLEGFTLLQTFDKADDLFAKVDELEADGFVKNRFWSLLKDTKKRQVCVTNTMLKDLDRTVELCEKGAEFYFDRQVGGIYRFWQNPETDKFEFRVGRPTGKGLPPHWREMEPKIISQDEDAVRAEMEGYVHRHNLMRVYGDLPEYRDRLYQALQRSPLKHAQKLLEKSGRIEVSDEQIGLAEDVLAASVS